MASLFRRATASRKKVKRVRGMRRARLQRYFGHIKVERGERRAVRSFVKLNLRGKM